MKSENGDLLRQLEQATSLAPLDSCLLDDETAQMRDSWLSLGQLLAAAEQESPAFQVSFPGRLPDRSAWLGWFVSCAAGLLGLAGAGWYVLGEARLGGHSSPATAHSTVVGKPIDSWNSEDEPLADESQLVTQPDAAQNNSELAWNDSLEDQLTQVRLAIWQLGESGRNGDPRWRYIAGELQRLNDELAGDSL